MARPQERHPQSAPGDFYVVNNECMSCGAPHVVAPDLIGWVGDSEHCIWKKQPENDRELEQAFEAFRYSCVCCYRYAGSDPKIIERLGSEYCDNATKRAVERKPWLPSAPTFALIENFSMRKFAFGLLRLIGRR